MRILKLFSLIIGVVAMFACGSETPKQEEEKREFDSVFVDNSNGLIRGSSMGDLPDSVLKKEKGNPTIESDSLVKYKYSYHLQTGKTEMNLYYTFDEFGLFEVQIDLYPETTEAAEALKTEIGNELTRKYGSSNELGALKRWTTFSRSNSIVEITLSDESADFGEPFISLNYLEPLPDEI